MMLHSLGKQPSPAWTHYWQGFAIVVSLAFLVPEIWALIRNGKNTLSDNIWRAEKFLPGQGVVHWTFFHFVFIGLLLLFDVWLLGHFGWGLWR